MRLTYETNMHDKIKDRKLHSKYFSKDFYEKSQCVYWDKVYTNRHCNAFEHEYSYCYSESSVCDIEIAIRDINESSRLISIAFLWAMRKVRLI